MIGRVPFTWQRACDGSSVSTYIEPIVTVPGQSSSTHPGDVSVFATQYALHVPSFTLAKRFPFDPPLELVTVAPFARSMTVPWHLPATQVSPAVQALPSSHEPPEIAVVTQAPVFGSHALCWHGPADAHPNGAPTQLPFLQVAFVRHLFAGLHGKPFTRGVVEQPVAVQTPFTQGPSKILHCAAVQGKDPPAPAVAPLPPAPLVPPAPDPPLDVPAAPPFVPAEPPLDAPPLPPLLVSLALEQATARAAPATARPRQTRRRMLPV